MKSSLLITLILSILSFGAFAQTELHVSPKGNDKWSGTVKKPFKTIEKAQSEVAKINQSMEGDIIVWLHGGEYPISNTLTFSAADGGTNGNQVIYKAYEKETPVLTGGTKITGWEKGENGIWQTKVPAELSFRQLYVNNKRAIRARQPNVGEHFELMGWDLRDRNLIAKYNDIEEWENFTHVEAVIQMYWAESIVHLQSVEKIKSGAYQAYVAINDKEAAILFPRPYPQKYDNASYHLENAFEFIDQPGEWYLNPMTHVLYYKPFPQDDINSIEIIAPVTETLISLKGTLDNPIKNITFEGLVIEHSNWDLPSKNGFINAQAGMYNLTANEENEQTVRRPGAAIQIRNAQNVRIEKNLIQHMGSTAVDLEQGTKECVVTGNVIRSIAGNGVMVGRFTAEDDGEYHIPYVPKDLREVSTRDEISNNFIHQIGRDYYGTCGVAAGYPAEIKISHNKIEDAPYSGISLGYGWTDTPNAMHDNLIANNHLSYVMNLICDGAAIYTLSLQPGTRIVENYIDKIYKSPTAGAWPVAHIYLDEKSGGTEEKPMVLERNSMARADNTVKTWNLHREGIVLLKHNSIYPVPEIKEKAGIQPEFKDTIEMLLKK